MRDEYFGENYTGTTRSFSEDARKRAAERAENGIKLGSGGASMQDQFGDPNVVGSVRDGIAMVLGMARQVTLEIENMRANLQGGNGSPMPAPREEGEILPLIPAIHSDCAITYRELQMAYEKLRVIREQLGA